MIEKLTHEAIEIANRLQGWIEDADGLSGVPQASVTYSQWIVTLSIGDIDIWDSESRMFDLTFENAIAEYVKCVHALYQVVADRHPLIVTSEPPHA